MSERYEQSTNPEIWTAAGRREMRISEMDDYHLLNTIDYLRRRANDYAARHNVDTGALLQRIPQYDVMMRELSVRGLTVVRSDAKRQTYDRFSGLIMSEQEPLERNDHGPD